uniref:Yip1 domain-containing protein n=1 Tax=Loigolactobacillus rennini TaxID=238013 RepID=A0A1K2I5F0_9LACO|nr:hypothetical protein LREN565_0738 [Loigolactobacillus rennini]
MKNWFSQVKATDTKIWIILYLIVGAVLSYFVAFIYPPKKILIDAPATVQWVTFGSSMIGVVLALFVTTYIGYFVYWLAQHFMDVPLLDKKQVKRSFYLTTCISDVIINFVHLILVIITGGFLQTAATTTLSVLSALLMAILIYAFFVYLLQNIKLGRVIAVVILVLNLLPVVGQILK